MRRQEVPIHICLGKLALLEDAPVRVKNLRGILLMTFFWNITVLAFFAARHITASERPATRNEEPTPGWSSIETKAMMEEARELRGVCPWNEYG
jgi:hypothetical protein